MKYRRLLLLLIAPLIMGVMTRATDPGDKIIPSSPQLGPYEVYQNDVTTSYTLTSTVKKPNSTYERFKFVDLSTGNERNVKTSNHYIPMLSSVTLSLTIPTSEFMGPSGMQISLSIYDSFNETLFKTYILTIYPPGSETINPLQYIDSGFTTKTIAVAFPDTEYTEKLLFDNYSNYFLTDIYYRLSFEQFDIKVESVFGDSQDGTGTMLIKKGKSLFPNLPTLGTNTIIGLKFSKIGEIYRIYLNNTLYVNPSLLLMSSNPIAGYVATNNFYFPINQMYEMQGLDITINIYQVGRSKTNLSWTSEYYPTSSIIGACNNSEYCIVGGVSS